MGMSYVKNDFWLDLSIGLVSGFSTVHKFGRNPDLNNGGGFEAIWNGGGDYTGFNVTVATTISCFSDNTADKGTVLSTGIATEKSKIRLVDLSATFISDGVTKGDVILDDTDSCHGAVVLVESENSLLVRAFDKGAGKSFSEVRIGDSYRVVTASSTGAAVIHLQQLLDENLSNESDEFVVLDGTTVVTTAGNYLRNPRLQAISVGSNLSNVGVITTFNTGFAANVFASMPSGYNQTMICAYTIPFDCRAAYLATLFASLAGKTSANCNVRLMVRHLGEAWNILEEFAIAGGGSSAVSRDYKLLKNAMSAGSDVKVMMDTDTNSTAVAAAIDLVIKQ